MIVLDVDGVICCNYQRRLEDDKVFSELRALLTALGTATDDLLAAWQRAYASEDPPEGEPLRLVDAVQGVLDCALETRVGYTRDWILSQQRADLTLAEVVDASAVVSMGGYNSVAEILTTNTPALLVPRDRPRQEQLIRARALQALLSSGKDLSYDVWLTSNLFSAQDSAYSSHSSQSSDNHSANSASNSAFSVISSVPSPAVNRPPLSTQSSPSKVSIVSSHFLQIVTAMPYAEVWPSGRDIILVLCNYSHN